MGERALSLHLRKIVPVIQTDLLSSHPGIQQGFELHTPTIILSKIY